MADLSHLSRCHVCRASCPKEAETRCSPREDQTGERWCPSTEWPLADLWEGTTTPEDVHARQEAEAQALIDWEATVHAKEASND